MDQKDGQDRPEAAPAPSEQLGARGRLGILLAAVGALAAFVWIGSRGSRSERIEGEAWSGTVTDVAEAFAGSGGLTRCSPDRAVCSRSGRGDPVPAGSILRTDASTRAVVELRDG